LILLLVLAWIVSSGVFGLIGVVIGAPEIVLLLPPAFIGLGTVWGTVRWMNRRDDPRHVEPPSDAPWLTSICAQPEIQTTTGALSRPPPAAVQARHGEQVDP